MPKETAVRMRDHLPPIASSRPSRKGNSVQQRKNQSSSVSLASTKALRKQTSVKEEPSISEPYPVVPPLRLDSVHDDPVDVHDEPQGNCARPDLQSLPSRDLLPPIPSLASAATNGHANSSPRSTTGDAEILPPMSRPGNLAAKTPLPNQLSPSPTTTATRTESDALPSMDGVLNGNAGQRSPSGVSEISWYSADHEGIRLEKSEPTAKAAILIPRRRPPALLDSLD